MLERRKIELEIRKNRLLEREVHIDQDVENLDLKIMIIKMYEELMRKKKKLENDSLTEQFTILKNMEKQIREKEEYIKHRVHKN